MEGAFLLTGLLTAGFLCGLHGLGEDVRCGSLRGADHVGIDPERDSRVGMAQASRDNVNRYPGQQTVAAV
jgi:hypothetical protein